jgi:hypothetical protein
MIGTLVRILYAIGRLFWLAFVTELLWWVVSYTVNPTPQGIERAGTLIAEAAVPWWLPVLEVLAVIGGGGIVSAVLVMVFLRRLIDEDAV